MSGEDPELQNHVSAVTMVRGDAFFLLHWVRHYGKMLGRKACHVVLHGSDPELEDIAQGCNIITLPFRADPAFDTQRWRLLNNIVHGLQSYYRFVIVGDVDELIAFDPASGTDLKGYLEGAEGHSVITPLGLEVCHLPQDEPDRIDDVILGPRRFVRPAANYSKPAILSRPVKLSRGGHYAKSDRFHSPEGLFLFHLKHVDFDEYAAAMDRRNQFTSATGAHFRRAQVGRHWFSEFRGDDTEIFNEFAAYPRAEFEPEAMRARMAQSFAPRAESGFWQTHRDSARIMMELPDRFFGLI